MLEVQHGEYITTEKRKKENQGEVDLLAVMTGTSR